MPPTARPTPEPRDTPAIETGAESAPSPPPSPSLSIVEGYARAAAAAAGLPIDDAWWPSVVRHLDVLLVRAASLETDGITLPDDPAPMFHP